MNSHSPAIVRGTAQLDFQAGCDLHDNPHDIGTSSYQIWEDEMRRLLNIEAEQELRRLHDTSGFA